MSDSKDIFWIASPLAIKLRVKANRMLSKVQGLKKRVPLNDRRVFRKVEHWTLEIDGKCYEVVPDPDGEFTPEKFILHLCKPIPSAAEDWHKFRDDLEIVPEKRHIGKTSLTHEQIQDEVDHIWNNYNHGHYLFFTQNCQNFVTMLHQRIRASASTEVFEKVPDPISYRISEFAWGLVAAGAAYGTAGAYFMALAELSQAANAGAAAVAAGTTTTGGTGAAAHTATHGAMIKGTGGGAVKAGAGAKGAAGAKTAGGLGAKAVAAMHTAAGGKAAVLGPAMVKAGGAAAVANPLLAAALASSGAGLILLAVWGKGDVSWSRKNKKKQKEAMSGMSVLDALEVEDTLLDPEVEAKVAAAMEKQAEVETVEELAEEVELMAVTTEPGIIDETSDAAVIGEDSRRAQTVA